jgi:hypothetical protein
MTGLSNPMQEQGGFAYPPPPIDDHELCFFSFQQGVQFSQFPLAIHKSGHGVLSWLISMKEI